MSNIEWKAQGDANEYVLLKDGNWLAAIKMNGELMTGQQEELVAAFAAAPDMAEQLARCVRFLADLNGCDWIKGDDAGSVDMRQRAKALQTTAFAAIAKAKAEAL